MPWFQGNLHCHTTNSDGDSSPAYVAQFYKDAGFDFVAITDHNHLTLSSETAAACDSNFLHIPSSEYTALKAGDAHVNGLGLSRPFSPTPLPGMAEALQEGVDQARAQGALSMLNHPNWRWAYGASDIAKVQGAELLEIYNGSYTCNSEGAPGRPGTEAIWDELLSQGMRLWGAGSDDCHKFQGPFKPRTDPPCSAWSVVEAESLSLEHILASLKSGRFYATTRILLDTVEAGRGGLKIRIQPWEEVEFYTDFIGKGGKVLKRVGGLNPEYAIKGDEGYVRAKVQCSDRHMAWTQPVFI